MDAPFGIFRWKIPVGASAIVTVNYGSDKYGTAGVATNDIAEAASWVAYANITNHWGIKYWEIGNEQNGNGFYGSQWEEDLHANKSPTAYGSNAVLFINAMKAVDPTIKIGVGMVQPGAWPDASESPPLPYNRCVLTNCGSVIDFVILHWYPGGNAATVLTQPATIPAYVKSVRTALTNYVGATRAGQIGIAITETDGGTNTGPVESLYCADEYLTWFENGVFNMDWQELHVWEAEHAWSPNQLRHNAATNLRREFGLDGCFRTTRRPPTPTSSLTPRCMERRWRTCWQPRAISWWQPHPVQARCVSMQPSARTAKWG